MDFLKSTIASAISKAPPFPYKFLDRVADPGIFTLYNGTAHSTGAPCSIFTFELHPAGGARGNQQALWPLAKNAVKRWRTLRHPGVVRVLDSVETDSYIYIATERVVPLDWHIKRSSLAPETIKWGLWNIATTLKFINTDASCIHGNIRADSVFTGESGEWKLAGFEVLSAVKDDEPFIYRYGSLLPDSGRYAAPEIGRGGWGGLKDLPAHVTDSWGFAVLIYEAFNGTFPGSDQMTAPKKIPSPMAGAYKRLIAANPKTRLSVAHFLEQGTRSGGFFDIPLVHISQFVENMGVKSQEEREEFLDELERAGDQFPEDFFKMKILPELLKSVEFGYGGAKCFDAVLRIGEKLTEEEWEGSITPAVVRLFALQDRATRVFLLENLPRMIDHLSKKVVSDKIFPEMVTGFSDVAPILREQTVKAVLTIAPKLSDRILNGDLLRHLARTQNDEQPGIRTNTTICLGKIAQYLGKNTRQKVLVAAFTRSLRDPFVHARSASLLALSATSEIFDETDCATRVIPAISPSLVDKESVVRTQAQKTLDLYLARIRTLTANYPEHATPTGTPSAGTPAAESSTGGWAGWAISSFTKTLASAAVEGEIKTKSPPPVTASAPTTAASTPVVLTKSAASSPAPNPKPSSSSFLPDADDDDDMQGWDSPDDTHTPAEEFFDAPAKPAPKPVRLADAVPGGKVSSFGPKPFSLNPKKPLAKQALAKQAPAMKKAELDFEEMAGTRKGPSRPVVARVNSAGPVKGEVKKEVPVIKAGAEEKKKEEGGGWLEDEDEDWGEGWGA